MANQKVIWIVQFDDGSQIPEFDENGKETVFTEVIDRKSSFRYIGLKDTVNNIQYSIDLDSGAFILNGLPINISKEIDGRVFTLPKEVDFRDGVIQFKCSKPMSPSAGPMQASPRAFNIGYKIDLPQSFCTYKGGLDVVSIVKCQALLTLDADTLQPSISITFTRQITTEDGRVFMQKI